ncbi:Transcriptional regulator KdgR [compost metagenome]
MGRIIAGLSLSLPVVRFEEAKGAELVRLLHEAASHISADMGFHDYPFVPR